MTWQIRHQGSPTSVGGLDPAQIIEGLQNGRWDPEDEVRGPADEDWRALEDHPEFADLVEEIEPPARPEPEDETRLDMNPLIDVTLVLLIFFILTTSYAALQKSLAYPASAGEGAVPEVKQSDVERYTIQAAAVRENGAPVIRIQGEVVAKEKLAARLTQLRQQTRKSELLLDAADDVDWETFIAVQSAATEAGIEKIIIPQKPKPAAGK